MPPNVAGKLKENPVIMPSTQSKLSVAHPMAATAANPAELVDIKVILTKDFNVPGADPPLLLAVNTILTTRCEERTIGGRLFVKCKASSGKKAWVPSELIDPLMQDSESPPDLCDM